MDNSMSPQRVVLTKQIHLGVALTEVLFAGSDGSILLGIGQASAETLCPVLGVAF